MSDLRKNMDFSRRMELVAAEKIGRGNVHRASLVFDRTEGTDLMLTTAPGGMRYGVRVRKHKFIDMPKWQMTIRSRARNGGPTEYDKLRAGSMCDYMLYAIANEDETGFSRWFIVNMHVWRQAIEKRKASGSRHGLHCDCITNRSDGTEFYVYDVTKAEFIASPMWMYDCSDPSFPGRVAVRDRYAANSNRPPRQAAA